jgi:hypothetical protein
MTIKVFLAVFEPNLFQSYFQLFLYLHIIYTIIELNNCINQLNFFKNYQTKYRDRLIDLIELSQKLFRSEMRVETFILLMIKHS